MNILRNKIIFFSFFFNIRCKLCKKELFERHSNIVRVHRMVFLGVSSVWFKLGLSLNNWLFNICSTVEARA